MSSLEQQVKQQADELGFHLVGIASAEPFEHAQQRSLSWLERGFQAEMGWMNEARTRLACDPERLLPGARSIVAVGVSYLTDTPEPSEDRPRGRIARYARGDDYHELMRARLWELVGFLRQQVGEGLKARVCVDSSPFPDREAAVRAGLGFYGKNTTLLTGPLGSFLFLGAVLTNVELEPDRPRLKDCGQCRLCLDACPTQAFPEPYVLDANRCISYLTIEHRGSIAPELRPMLGEHVFGCDICQEVCPWNTRVLPLGWAEYRPRPGTGAYPDLVELLSLDAQTFRERFRHSPIKRAKRAGLLRNAAVALGNRGDRRAVPALAEALSDPEPQVRAHAAWALGRLGGPEAREALERALAREQDEGVREEIEQATLRPPGPGWPPGSGAAPGSGSRPR